MSVFVIDDQHPEDIAMLQALYSRSPASVVDHLEKLKNVSSGKFMEQYYVGYGHSSIGDCGTTTLFIEQVSMLVAKAIQNNPLYNGQEASTRYLDFSKQSVIDPYETTASRALQNNWMKIYNETLPKLIEGLKAHYPFDATQYKSEKVWQNALHARAFDIARSLLPIGTTTLLSWSTSLRSARDNLRRMKHHPLPEVRNVAQNIFSNLREKYPHSFRGDEMDIANDTLRDSYETSFALENHFSVGDDLMKRYALSEKDIDSMKSGEIVTRRHALDLEGLRTFEQKSLSERPQTAPLPWRLEAYGRYNFLFLLDFGSFRDIQRHRNAVCQIPLIDGRFGLHPWYLEQYASLLQPDDAQKLLEQIDGQFKALKELAAQSYAKPELTQYLFPMGTTGLVHVSYSVPETVYVAELRSSKTVHPSLRPIAQKMLKILAKDLPCAALYGDHDEDSWTAKRGEQTISSK